jgi:hypothetical protein
MMERFRRGRMRGAQDKVAVLIAGRHGAIGEFCGNDKAGRVGTARGRNRPMWRGLRIRQTGDEQHSEREGSKTGLGHRARRGLARKYIGFLDERDGRCRKR